jgi:DNA modification methylase
MASITSLQSDHKNARRRTDRSSELIKESLQRYGAARSIVIDEDNRILAGNGTIDGAKAAGIKNVRIIESDGDEIIAVKRTGLSEEQKVGLALADNRTADLSEWDQAMLHQLSEEHDLTPWFNQEDLDELLAVTELEPEEGNTDPDDVPEPPEDPTTKLGDLWTLGNHRLLCGDSTNPQHVERLMDSKKADFVYMDPPYGMKLDTDYSQNNKKQSQFKGNSYKKVEGDFEDYDPRFLIELFKDAREQFWWGADYYCQTLSKEGSWVVWDKRNETTDEVQGAAFELCWSINKHHKLIYRQLWCGYTAREKSESRSHPTQKPVALAEWFFERWGKAGDLVVDLYGGSGTTLIACERQHRNARLMELDPAYCDVIVKRWEEFTGNTAVCEPSDAHFEQQQEELDI